MAVPSQPLKYLNTFYIGRHKILDRHSRFPEVFLTDLQRLSRLMFLPNKKDWYENKVDRTSPTMRYTFVALNEIFLTFAVKLCPDIHNQDDLVKLIGEM